MAHRARSLLLVLLTALVLTGCGLVGVDRGAPSPPAGQATAAPVHPTPTPAAATTAPTADSVRAGGLPVTVGSRTVLHLSPVDPASTVTTQEDGDAVVVTVGAATAGAAVEVHLAAPADATIHLQDDGSLVTLGADGGLLGGAARPGTVTDAGRVTVTEAGDGLVLAAARGGDLRMRMAGRGLEATDWGEREGGRSLAVTPTPWARTAGQAGEVAVWTELVAAVPEADTQVMRDQLTCHAFGAPDKATWNLEPWRPDVGLFAVLAAACNPT